MAITESRIKAIEDRLEELTQNFLQMQENEVPVAEKADEAVNKANALTPYIDTKKAFYGESEKVFYNAPEGNTLVFFDNYNGSYSTNRIENRLVVSFEKLTQETNITISIQ